MKVYCLCKFPVFFLFLVYFFLLVSVHGYTTEEQESIKKLRSLVENSIEENFMKSDLYLYKWIKSKKTVERAAQEFLNNIKWRKANKLTGILSEDYSDVLKMAPFQQAGLTKTGEPVVELYFGLWDLRKMSLSGKGGEAVRQFTRMLEQTTQRIWKSKNATHYIVVVDLTGFNSMQQMCLSCIPINIELIRNYEGHYPSCVKNSFAQNTPKIFENLLTVIKPFMSEEYKSGLRVHGYDKKEFENDLFKFVDPDQVSTAFGGTRKYKVW